MMKHLLTTTAIVLALATPALAQTTTTQPAAETAQPKSQPSGATTPGAEKAIIPEQAPSQLRAEDLLGTKVFDAQGKNVGSVDDLIFDEQQKITGVVVGVGGFLGIGKKDVGLNWQQAKFLEDRDAGTKKIVISLTKADLEAAPDFKTKEERKAEEDAAAQQKQVQQMQQQQQPQPMTPTTGTGPSQSQ
jgi:sporulation protein YlmC with PRC-barrel domain